MYPQGFVTRVDPGPLGDELEGRSRPGHFRGVATVVTRLFGLVRPRLAFFGEKDYQQLVIVRRVARDLALGVEVVGVPTVRDADGLALSSRNRFLSAAEREQATSLPAAPDGRRPALRRGRARRGSPARCDARAPTRRSTPDYLELRRRADLGAYDPSHPAILLVAARPRHDAPDRQPVPGGRMTTPQYGSDAGRKLPLHELAAGQARRPPARHGHGLRLPVGPHRRARRRRPRAGRRLRRDGRARPHLDRAGHDGRAADADRGRDARLPAPARRGRSARSCRTR